VANLSSDLASLRIARDVNPNRPGRGRAWLILVLMCLAGVGVWTVGYPKVRPWIFRTEVSVADIAMVSPAQASVTVTSTGYVVPQTRSSVSTKVLGRLVRVPVQEGDTVKTGDVIAELESSNQRRTIVAAAARAEAVTARIAAAEANVAEVQRQVERSQALVAKGALPVATLEDLELHHKSLEAQVKATIAEARASEADLGPMRVDLGEHTLLAPIDGTVITKPLQVGELVLPQTTITEIADFRSMLVETDVPEAELYQVKVASPCEIVLDAYPARRYRGEVVEIGSRVNRDKATVIVKVKFVDSMDGVLPDMAARTSFLSQAISESMAGESPKKVVPANAVVRRGEQTLVFAVEEDSVRLVPVKLGGPFGGGIELVDGPGLGTRVVVDPPGGLIDGQRIKEKVN
jgi:HlyD family secretion protein